MNVTGKMIVFVIRGYQIVISPLLGNHCRFYPSCSAYWIDAISKYGVIKGVAKGILRLLKCHPFHPGGVDYA